MSKKRIEPGKPFRAPVDHWGGGVKAFAVIPVEAEFVEFVGEYNTYEVLVETSLTAPVLVFCDTTDAQGYPSRYFKTLGPTDFDPRPPRWAALNKQSMPIPEGWVSLDYQRHLFGDPWAAACRVGPNDGRAAY